MPRIDDLNASVQGILGYMQAVRQGNAAQAQQMFTNTMQTLEGLKTAASTRESLSLTMARDELLPFKKRQAATQAETGEIGLANLKTTMAYLQQQLGKETTPEGIKQLTDAMANLVNLQQRQTELERGVGRARGVAAGAAAGAELAEAGERAARARTGIVTEPGRRERIREEDVLAATTARAEMGIVEPVTARKKAEAEAAVPIAELAGERAQAEIDIELSKEQADIAKQLLATEIPLRNAQIAALKATKAGQTDLERTMKIAGPIFTNIRQAEQAILSIDAQEFDPIALLVMELRGIDVAGIEDDPKKQEKAKKRLLDFINVQKALLKEPGLDIDYDELARQSILSPEQQRALAEQARQRRQGGTLE